MSRTLIVFKKYKDMEISETVVTGSGIAQEGQNVFHVLPLTKTGHYIREAGGVVRAATQGEVDDANGVDYKERRKRDYPPITDQLDQIYKTIKHLASNGLPVGLDALQLISSIDAVKQRHPKG